MSSDHVHALTLNGEAPQQRYAGLHRAIDAGHAKDQHWMELSRICVQLGHADEARNCLGHIEDPADRRQTELYLVRRGLLAEDPKDEQPAAPVRAVDMNASFKEEVGDAVSFLFLEHMPLTVMAATLVFPLVLGLGGFLTAGSELWVLPTIALVPVLSALGVVGALTRQILLEASRGIDDPPRLPSTSTLARNAGRFLIDGLAIFCAFVLPGCLMLHFGLPLAASLPLLALGLALTPMALALRQMRDDWQSLHPRVLFPACYRGGLPYLKLLGVGALAFAPAFGAAATTAGSELYLRLSFIGPLAIAPLFVGSRLLGRVMFQRRLQLSLLAADQTGHMRVEVTAAGPEAIRTYESRRHESKPKAERPTPKPTRRKRRPRLDAPTHPEAKKASKARQPSAQQKRGAERKQAQAKGEQRAKTRANIQAESMERSMDTASKLAELMARQDQQQPRRGQPESEVVGEAPPDLTQMPGFTVLRGDERAKAGAAASHEGSGKSWNSDDHGLYPRP